MDYGGLAIFHNISNQEVEAMIHCFQMRRSSFDSGRTIRAYGAGQEEVGVVLKGAAVLVRLDYAGTRTILERLEPGGVFGEALAFTPSLGDCVEVVSDGGTDVLFMEYSHIMKRCEKACVHHSKLVQNMFQLVAGQTQRLSRRVRSSAAGVSGKSFSVISPSALRTQRPIPLPSPSPSAPWRTTSARTAAQ